MSKLLFPDREEVNPERVSGAELAVGILGGTGAEGLDEKRLQICRCLREFFPGRRGVVILSDDGSDPEAGETFLRAPAEVPGIHISTSGGGAGTGDQVLNFLEKARELGADALAVVRAASWKPGASHAQDLLEPLFNEFSLVTPLYARNPNETPLTTNLVYPLLRSLFGKRVREPMGGDFGLSGQLADLLLEEVPADCVRGFGFDVWLTTTAVARGVPLCQTFLGPAPVPEAPVPEPLPLFAHTVETLFLLMDKYHEDWKRVRWSKPTVVFGAGARNGPRGQAGGVDPAVLHTLFLDGFSRFAPLWKKVLHRDVLEKLREVKKFPLETFEFPALMWALSLFAFALAYKRSPDSAGTLMESLRPLYAGRTCSTVISTSHMSPQQAEVYLDEQCRVFEETKPYLEYLWEKRRARTGTGM
jgi:hypothetical protein